jgi:dipeptidyl aminopeptidase/acylaminoacyl peptidase
MMAESTSRSSRLKRVVLMASAVLVGGAIVAAGAWLLSLDHRQATGPKSFEPAQETSAPADPSVITSGATTATPSVTPSVTPPEPTPSTGSQTAAKVAFRLGGALYVADEDGSDAQRVGRSESGAFSLSPDGSVLAVADEEKGLILYNVTTGAARTVVDDASVGVVVWSPDSKWAAFDGQWASTPAVRRVSADGRGATPLVRPGMGPAISPDNARVAYRRAAAPDEAIRVLAPKTGRDARVEGTKGATSWAWGPGADLYFTRVSEAAAIELLVVPSGRKSPTRVTEIPAAAPAYTASGLVVSPDGQRALLAATGDDEYSRLWVVELGTGWARQLTTRRDAYPYRWSADGSRVLYFEGNSYQGEPSVLMSVNADGTGRQAIVTGATR